MPGGVERFFDRVELGAQMIAGAATAPEQSSAQRAEDVTQRVGGITADVFGYESERRALAKSVGVDPYTTNPVLSKKLNDMAWVAFSGRVGVNALITVFVPVSIAVSASSVTNAMIYDTPAADLITRNEQTLRGLSASEQQARALIKNPWYSLSVLTSLVMSLDRLAGVDGRPAVVALALTATTEDQARFLASAVEMLAAHHRTVEPLAEVIARGTVIGRTQSGALFVPGAVDYVAWTEQVSGFAGRTELQGTPRTGGSGPNPRRALGIEVADQAPPGLTPYVRYARRYYSVADKPWDRQPFALLYQLFQMTVTDVSAVGVPITISR